MTASERNLTSESDAHCKIEVKAAGSVAIRYPFSFTPNPALGAPAERYMGITRWCKRFGIRVAGYMST